MKKGFCIWFTGLSGRFEIIQMPNVTNIVYGRSVGYGVNRVDLPAEIEAISATKIRQKENKDGE